jgi:hypothetical protein
MPTNQSTKRGTFSLGRGCLHRKQKAGGSHVRMLEPVAIMTLTGRDILWARAVGRSSQLNFVLSSCSRRARPHGCIFHASIASYSLQIAVIQFPIFVHIDSLACSKHGAKMWPSSSWVDSLAFASSRRHHKSAASPESLSSTAPPNSETGTNRGLLKSCEHCRFSGIFSLTSPPQQVKLHIYVASRHWRHRLVGKSVVGPRIGCVLGRAGGRPHLPEVGAPSVAVGTDLEGVTRLPSRRGRTGCVPMANAHPNSLHVQERGKCESGMGRVILGGLPQIAPKTFFSAVNFKKIYPPQVSERRKYIMYKNLH